ncbi:MAG: class C beta-lactamase-related serine hydrolase [Cytophagia bacterium]|nr:class C beta-lactamase-related serine hydrolase [Cytophagia bacterium]
MTLMHLALSVCISIQSENAEPISFDQIKPLNKVAVSGAIDTAKLHDIANQIRTGDYGDVSSVIIYKGDQLIFEEYYTHKKAKYRPTEVHGLQSATKSIASLLIGILQDKGYIKSIDEQIINYFPEYNIQDSLKRTITIRHLLLMSSGISWNEGKVDLMDAKSNDIRLLNESDDYIEYYLNKPMDTIPGSVFQYSGGCSITLGEIIRRSSGMTVEQFANKFLFEPLAIIKYKWTKSKSGQYNTGGGLYLLPKDFAKIGLLVKREGKWNDQQIISQKWIEESIKPQIKTDWKNGFGEYFLYGYQWWTIKMASNIETIAARGWGDQRLVLVPQLDMVIAINATNFFDKKPRKKIDELLLSLLKTDSEYN